MTLASAVKRPRRPRRSSTPQTQPRARRSSPTLSPPAKVILDAWADHLATNTDLARKTRTEYVADVRQFVAWWEIGSDGSFRPREFGPHRVTTAALAGYREYMQTDLELAWRSINRALSAVKFFFGGWVMPIWAGATGIQMVDPAGEVKLLRKGAQKLPRQLTPDEVELLVGAARQHGDHQAEVLLRVMATSGARAEEVCALGRGSYQKGTSWDPPSLSIIGKGRKHRIVPIPRDTARLLEGYIGALPDQQRNLWSNQYGKPLTYSNLHDLLQKHSDLAGVSPPVRPHDMRHYFGYEHASRGTPLNRLQEYMGHESLDTTAIYTRGRVADRRADAERMSWR